MYSWSSAARFLTVVLVLLAASPARASDITGTYVGSGPKVAAMLVVVETTEGAVTGRLLFYTVGDQGKTTTTDLVVSGTERNGTFVGQVRTDAFLSDHLTISGSVGGGSVNLSVADKLLNLSRADEASYRAKIAELAAEAAGEQRITRMMDYTTQVSQLITKQHKFANGVETTIPKLLLVPDKYKHVTQTMQAELEHEQTIVGGGQASVARGQLSVAIHQQQVAVIQLHLEVQNTYRQFMEANDRLERESIDMGQGCHRAHADTADSPVPPSDQAWNTTCLQLFQSTADFEKRRKEGARLFTDIEDDWVVEQARQDGIARIADSVIN